MQACHRGEYFPSPGRPFFSEARLRPHKSQYWLTSKDKRESPQRYQAEVENTCDTYLKALAAEGAHITSTDEKTGTQALERMRGAKPARAG